MILLKTLTIENFLSHQLTKIEFLENQKFSIEGRSGAGKSTIVDSILWCLYNKARSDNRNLVRKGQKLATVSLQLIDNNITYIITRSMSVAGKHTLNVTKSVDGSPFVALERTGKKDLDDWIQNTLLKSSFALFSNSIAYPQEQNDSFVKANASKRKDLLLEIVRAGNFDELYDKARKLISTLETENAVNLSKITFIEESIKHNTEIASNLESYKKIYDDTSYKLGGLEIEEKDLESQLREISNAVKQIDNNKRMIKVLNDSIVATDIQIDFNNKEIEEHNKIDPKVYKKDIEESEKLSKEVENIETELKNSAELSGVMYNHLANKPQVFDYSKDIKEINERLVPLIKDSDKCPAGDACPWIAPIQGQITYLKEQLIDRENKSKKETRDLYNWELTKTTLSPIKDTTELYNRLKDIQTRIQFLSKSKDLATKYLLFKDGLEELNTKQLSRRTERQEKAKEVIENERVIKTFEEQLVKFDINKVNSDLSNLRLSKKEEQKRRDEASVNKQLAINAQEEVKVATLSLVEAQKGVVRVSKNLESLQLLKSALSEKGIKTVVIDYILPSLEEKINDILSQLSDFRIRLDTQQNKSNEDDGVKEGLWIIVKNPEGIELPLSNLSGGETVKISIAISEALSSLQGSIGFRLMDENIVSLDKESTESFIEVLTKLQDKFQQLLIISHLPEIQELFSNKIEIKKVNGISQITK